MAKYGCERYPDLCDNAHPIGDTTMGDTRKLCDRCEVDDRAAARIVELERQRDTNKRRQQGEQAAGNKARKERDQALALLREARARRPQVWLPPRSLIERQIDKPGEG